MLVGVVVNRQAAGTGNFAQGIAKNGILQDEAHNVRVVADTRIALEFRQHFVRRLGLVVVAALLVSRGIKTVADGDDVNHEALRRGDVIKVVRIAAFAVVELVVAAGDIHIARQILVDAQVLPAAVRVGADDAELIVRACTASGDGTP